MLMRERARFFEKRSKLAFLARTPVLLCGSLIKLNETRHSSEQNCAQREMLLCLYDAQDELI